MSKHKGNAPLWKNEWPYIYEIRVAGKANVTGKLKAFGIRAALAQILDRHPKYDGRVCRIENVGVQNHQRYEFELGRPAKWRKVEFVT